MSIYDGKRQISQSHYSERLAAILASWSAAQQSVAFPSSEVQAAAAPLPLRLPTADTLRGLRSITAPPSCGPLVCGVMTWCGPTEEPPAPDYLLHQSEGGVGIIQSRCGGTRLIRSVMWFKCEAEVSGHSLFRSSLLWRPPQPPGGK